VSDILNKINITNLSFSYENPYKEIFNNLDIEIDTSWKTIIYGKNGRGKSTLLKLIDGELIKDGGEIKCNKTFFNFSFQQKVDEKIRVLDFIKDNLGSYKLYEDEMKGLLFDPTEDNLIKYGEIEGKYRELDGYQIENLIERELLNIKLDLGILNRFYNSLSGGEKTKIQLISLFLKKGSYPLIDEPTNHLDIESRKLIGEYLKNQKRGFICISHDRKFLNTVGDHILHLHTKREAKIYSTTFFKFEENYLKLLESEQRKNILLKNQINRGKESLKQKENWAKSSESKKRGAIDKGFQGRKAAKMMKTAKSNEKKCLEKIEGKEKLVQFFEKEYEIKFKDIKLLPQKVLRVDNLNISYEDKKVISNLSFSIDRGERIAITGPNGSGKTSIIKAVLNQIKFTGNIFIDSRINIGYLPQELLPKNMTLEEFLIDLNIDIKLFTPFLAAFDIRGNLLSKDTSLLSQGETRKLYIALNIYLEKDFFIWDEPLNFLDLHTRTRIEKAILKYNPTILFIEHDDLFVERIANKVITLKESSESIASMAKLV